MAESPVAAYIKGKQKAPRIITDSKDIKEISKSKLGNTWTCALSDKSLVEVIQSDGLVSLLSVSVHTARMVGNIGNS